MAIKINLLPQSYALEKKRNRWLAGMAGLLGVTALSIGLLYLSDQKQLQKVNSDIEGVEPVARLTAATEQERDTLLAEVASVKTVVDFLADAAKSGPERAALLDLVRRYIYERALVSDIDLSNGTDAKITATVNTPDDYARFLLALRQGAEGGLNGVAGAGKLFDGLPGASGVPGFPEGRPLNRTPPITETPQAIVYPFKIDALGKLKTDANPRNTLTYLPPEPPGTAIAATNAQAGGAPGGSPNPAPSAAPPPPPPVPAPSAAPTAP